jgi:hypothetical protein
VQEGSLELKHLVRSLEGGSTRVLPSATTALTLDDCPLKDYLAAVLGLSREPGLVEDMRSKIDGWEGTRRQWIELFATVGADSVGIWGEDPRTHKRRLADAVLRSLRLSTIWSVLLAGEGLERLVDREGRQWPSAPPAKNGMKAPGHQTRPRQPVQPQQAQAYSPTDFPVWAADALDTLSDPGSPPGPEDRIDDVSCSDVDYMTWRVPRRRCLLTVMGITNERFPNYSLLAASGWIGHMLVGAASATETMLELAMKTSQPLDISKRAKASYEFIIELEEMYDLDVTWLVYAQFFRNIRNKLGIDEQYGGIRERVNLLTRYTEVQESIKRADERSKAEAERSTAEAERGKIERDNFVIGSTAAILAIILIALTAFGTNIYLGYRILSAGGSVLLVLGVAIVLWQRRRARDRG